MSEYSDRSNCRSARLCYYDLLDTETEKSVPEDVREHVASCAECQFDINRLRELLASADKSRDSEQSRRNLAIVKLLSLHFEWADRPVRCRDAKSFLPSLADTLLKVRIPTPITAHLDNCRICSEELAALKAAALTHKQLCRLSRYLAKDPDVDNSEIKAVFPPVTEMIERPDSGIVTRFTIRQSAESGSGGSNDDQAINVDVFRTHDDPPNRKQSSRIVNIKRYLVPAIAAAVVLIGISLLFTGPAAKAVGVARIYTTVKEIDNIHISKFKPGRTEPIEETWVSRSREIYMSRIGKDLVLWDIPKDLRKRKETVDAVPESITLNKNDSAGIKKLIKGTLDITPFSDLSNMPAGAEWKKIDIDIPDPEIQGCEVYDLIWISTNNTRGDPVSMRWRYFVESGSGLPLRIESSYKSPADEDYTADRVTFVEYLDAAGIDTAIEENGL